MALSVWDHREGGGVGATALTDRICGHAPVGDPDEPFLGVVVYGPLNGSLLGSGSLLEVLDYVVDVGGAVLHQERVDEVSGSASWGGPCLEGQWWCPIS